MRTAAKEKRTAKAAFVAKFVGALPVMKRLDLYRPNDWNPNEVTPEERKALREVLRNDGWAMSQAMLVWATDENGKKQNLIIDGEHRWDEAIKLGFVEGPVVELRKISRATAVSWTLRIDKIRGTFNDRKVARVLDAEFGLFAGSEETLGIALRLGFSSDELDSLRLKLNDVAGAGAQAPSEFPQHDEGNTTPDHECPRCHYRF